MSRLLHVLPPAGHLLRVFVMLLSFSCHVLAIFLRPFAILLAPFWRACAGISHEYVYFCTILSLIYAHLCAILL